MTNAITNHGTVQTRINGIGSALRCVAVVGREVRARQVLKRGDLLCCHGLHLSDPGKQVPAPHAPFAPQADFDMSMSPASPPRMSAAAWRRPLAAATRPQADTALPAAAWASLVIARAISA